MENSTINLIQDSPIQKIALLGNSLPRLCGIATFSTDLGDSLEAIDPTVTIGGIAMSDRKDYVYPDRVKYQIADQDFAAYGLAADYVNAGGFDVLSVQHEYGIFGGTAGGHLMGLVREVKIPIVTTLHTVLRDPSDAERAVMDELLQLSERVVVMSEIAVEFLAEVHGTCRSKIDVIPHGIPKIGESAGRGLKARLAIEGPMILTFGLLSPDKGLQFVIGAMPKIIEQYPGATYVIVGATHPNIRATDGENYRDSLQLLVAQLGIEANVRFIDRFVTKDELIEDLGAMDIYITPYLNPKQITSGTLAYAVGAGKAVISTPYWYAEELLADGRGKLVAFRDADAIARAVVAIIADPEAMLEMGRKARAYGQKMLWPEVAKSYLDSFARAKIASANRLRLILAKSPASKATTLAFDEVATQARLPRHSVLRLDHLIALTDDTGIIQHATYTIPNRSEGYCVDDNARALLFTTFFAAQESSGANIALLQSRYLSFVLDAYNPRVGRFRNFMSYDRRWLESVGSEDSHGRSLWALGALARRSTDVSRCALATRLFEIGSVALSETTSPRTWAYAVLGCEDFLHANPANVEVESVLREMSRRLLELYQRNRTPEWPWFERSLTYANARLSQALIVGGASRSDHEMLDSGIESLKWLMEIQTGPRDVFAPIGSDGFYHCGESRAFFDQQPLEAWASMSACLTALEVTGDPKWIHEATRSYDWFLGENMLSVPLYDAASGGCHDGLHESRLNRNQGAESTLSFLCASAEWQDAASRNESTAFKSNTYEVK